MAANPKDDPFAAYQKPAADPFAAYQKPAPTAGPVLVSKGNQAQQGFVSSALESSGLTGFGHALAHPLDTAKGVIPGVVAATKDSVQNLRQAYNDTYSNPASSATHLLSAIPVLGHALNKATDQYADKNYAGEMGTLTGLASSVLAPRLAGAALDTPKALGRILEAPLTSGLDEVIPGTSVTPRARFAAAQRMGVNLDLADATNSPVANVVKAVGRDSLAGSGVYEKARAANIAALGNATDQTLAEMSPLDREAGGVRLQDLLKNNQQQLKDASDAGHGYIQSHYGDAPIPLNNSRGVFGTADLLQGQGARHAGQFPSLATPKVDAIVRDASSFGKPTAPTTGKILPGYDPPTVSDALRARSGILDVYQNNPELVKGASDAKLQTLVGATHDAIMGSLPDEAQRVLRDAQLSFKEQKQVYDNPSSPYYDAVRTPNPSSKVTGIGPQTPESVRGLVARAGPEGQGIVQRGVAGKLLGTAPGTDEYNFRSFPMQLSRTPSDYAQELFGNKLPQLQDISDTSQALSRDLNPSGTAKQGQKLAEAGMLLPTGGLPLLQYPAAKLMNSPAVVNYFMRQPLAANPLARPAIPLALGSVSGRLAGVGALPSAGRGLAATALPAPGGDPASPSLPRIAVPSQIKSGPPEPAMTPAEIQKLQQMDLDPLSMPGRQHVARMRERDRNSAASLRGFYRENFSNSEGEL